MMGAFQHRFYRVIEVVAQYQRHEIWRVRVGGCQVGIPAGVIIFLGLMFDHSYVIFSVLSQSHNVMETLPQLYHYKLNPTH